ncbi:Ig-like domain repeat protein [Cryobacterium melibiosiphilum]|uniref:Ig-like domain repeat protein n=1 Tax=Cryobacterium melibiosiphilum TaxID=995039 RepID=A0A3A5MG00_9MICO|nr:Ig-like domain repeat protein [Cryobacterium melibiosiphilum]RJT86899.1 Ig-like domain repeat protein [Cryobacterium melibiosiphilum]
MKNFSRKIAAVAVMGAVILGSFSAVQAASAATTDSNYIGEFSITPTTGKVDGSHHEFGNMITSHSAATGCPAGYRGMSGTFVFQDGVTKGPIATARKTDTTLYGSTGLDGSPISADQSYSLPTNNPFVSVRPWPTVGVVNPGAFELRYYCFSLSTSVDYVNDKYYSLAMTLSADSTTWSVAVPAAASTTSLSAVSNSDSTVTLTATVKDENGVATSAVGDVDFLDGTGTVIGTAALSNGVATFTTPVLASGASYTFTSRFGSTSADLGDSASTGFTVNIAGETFAATTVSVVVPSGIGGFSLTGVASAVTLPTAALDTVSNTLKSTGSLGSAVVTDTRQLGTIAWSLTGTAGDFVDATDDTKVIDGKALGWVPVLVGTDNAGVAGASVAAAATGLKVPSTLATGSVVDGKLLTATSAALNFEAPANTPSGSYSTTLTLTLI